MFNASYECTNVIENIEIFLALLKIDISTLTSKGTENNYEMAQLKKGAFSPIIFIRKLTRNF